MIRSSVESTFDFCFGYESPEEWRFDDFINHYRGLLTDERGFKYSPEELTAIDKDAWRESLVERALEIYHGKDKLFEDMTAPDAPQSVIGIKIFTKVEKIFKKPLDKRKVK